MPVFCIGLISPRSSHRKCSIKKGALKNFVKFTGKRLCQIPFLKKETLAQLFSCERYEIFKNTFFVEHIWVTAYVAHLSLPCVMLKNDQTYFQILVCGVVVVI